MSEADSALDASSIQVLSAILHDIAASEHLQKFTDDDHDDESIIALSFTKPHKIAKRYGLSLKLAATFVEKCCIAADSEELAAAFEFVENCRTSPAAQQHGMAVCTAALSRLHFQVISELGKGAFGTVFKCKNRTDKRTVAVKFVNDSKNSKEAMREGQRLVKCDHPNIVRMHKVHELGNGRCALEMELVSGGDLSQHLEAARRRPERRLPRDTVIRFSRQLLDALHYLHEKSQLGLLHGDIKPQNILVKVACGHPPVGDSPIDYSDSEIKLADFGLAKTVAALSNTSMITNASTVAGMIKGTMWYISPEALQGAAQGRERCFADDLWSACLVIFEMDTGLTVQQLMTAPGAININEMLTKASAHLLPLLFSVFASDPASRCSSAKELVQILDSSIEPLFEWQSFDTSTQKFVLVHPAAAFVLEKSFLANQPQASLSLQPPLDLNVDIRPLLKSAAALGIQTQRSTGITLVIRRMLKSSVLTSGASIPVWQEMIDAMEWRQCDPSTCAKLEIDMQKSSASPDPSRYRRVILQPGSIDKVQIPCPLKSEPYLEPAQAADIAAMTARLKASLPDWEISEMLQIVNPSLQSKYADYRHRTAVRCNGDPNERMLFHFSPEFVIPKIWQEGEGHDPRLSVWAEIGKGAYFSEHLMYSYAYNFKLWPSPSSGWIAEPDPACGATMRVFATLVSLGNVANMGPGCETCPSDPWNAWKQEFAYQKSPQNLSPKPTRPPVMPLPSDAAQKQHLLDLMQVKDAPRYDSVVSTEGDLATHPASTNNVPSGERMCDVMHPRLKNERAFEWGQQYVVFDTAASYPFFLMTLKKTRESPRIYADGRNLNGTNSVDSFPSINEFLSAGLAAFTITNLFMSNCPNLSSSAIIDALQCLNAASLRSLTLRNAGVDDSVLKHCFGRFLSLKSLDVGENSALINIHPTISMLKALKHLGLSKCSSVMFLPDELLELRASLKSISTRDCASLVFPPKFVLEQGCDKIFQFLKDALKSKPLRRVKILFLGNAGSGKTSFLHALANLPLQPCDDGPDGSIDVEERLKSASLTSKLQNLPELSYYDFPWALQNVALDLISFHRQTVFVIFFSVTDDTRTQMQQVLGWLRAIESIQVSHQLVRFVVVGTKLDLMLQEDDPELKGRIDQMRGVISTYYSSLKTENKIEILCVTSMATHVQYDDLRRKFKDHIRSLSKSIFEGAHVVSLRFPDCFQKVLFSIDALKKKTKPGEPTVIQLQKMIDVTAHGELVGAHKDPLKLDALKMLHDIGELVFIDAVGDKSPSVLLKPQFLSRIVAPFADIHMSREAIEGILQTVLRYPSPEDAQTLFDLLSKSQLFVAVNADITSRPSLRLYAIPSALRSPPRSWKEIFGQQIGSCVRGLRVVCEENCMTLPSFVRAMLSFSGDRLGLSRMWTGAFSCQLEDGTLFYSRLADSRTIDIVVFGDLPQLCGKTVRVAFRQIAVVLCSVPFCPFQLCPFCCASDKYVRDGVAHAFSSMRLLSRKCNHAVSKAAFLVEARQSVILHNALHFMFNCLEQIETFTTEVEHQLQLQRLVDTLQSHIEIKQKFNAMQQGLQCLKQINDVRVSMIELKSSSPIPANAYSGAIQSMSNIQELIDAFMHKVENSKCKIKQNESKIKDILRDCGGDEKKKEREKDQFKRLLESIKESRSVESQYDGIIARLQKIVDKSEDAMMNGTMLHAMQRTLQCLKQIVPEADDERGAMMELESSSPIPANAYSGAIQILSHIQELIDAFMHKVENSKCKIKQNESKIKDILRDCGGDEKKKEREKDQFKRLLESIKESRSTQLQYEGRIANLQDIVYNLQDVIQCAKTVDAMHVVQQSMQRLKHLQIDPETFPEADNANAYNRAVQEQVVTFMHKVEDKLQDAVMIETMMDPRVWSFQHDQHLHDVSSPQTAAPQAGAVGKVGITARDFVPDSQKFIPKAAIEQCEVSDEDDGILLVLELDELYQEMTQMGKRTGFQDPIPVIDVDDDDDDKDADYDVGDGSDLVARSLCITFKLQKQRDLLKKFNTYAKCFMIGCESVEQLVDDIQDKLLNVDEISAVLSSAFENEAIDEDDLMACLEELENEHKSMARLDMLHIEREVDEDELMACLDALDIEGEVDELHIESEVDERDIEGEGASTQEDEDALEKRAVLP